MQLGAACVPSPETLGPALLFHIPGRFKLFLERILTFDVELFLWRTLLITPLTLALMKSKHKKEHKALAQSSMSSAWDQIRTIQTTSVQSHNILFGTFPSNCTERATASSIH